MDIYDPNQKLVDRTKLAEEIRNKTKVREEEHKIKLTIENETIEQAVVQVNSDCGIDEETTKSSYKNDEDNKQTKADTNEDKKQVKKAKIKIGTSLMDATSSSDDEEVENTPTTTQSEKTQRRPSRARISRKARISQAKEVDGGVKNDHEDKSMEEN